MSDPRSYPATHRRLAREQPTVADDGKQQGLARRSRASWLPLGAQVFAVVTEAAGPLLVIELASGQRLHTPVCADVSAWTTLCARAWAAHAEAALGLNGGPR
jgi:hypothetical protein